LGLSKEQDNLNGNTDERIGEKVIFILEKIDESILSYYH
jgi:hypothetical protein